MHALNRDTLERRDRRPARSEAGVALAVAMIVLVILTLLGVAAMRVSKLELRMSTNAQSKLSALQQAQSIADAVIGTTSNLAILTGTDYFYCFSEPAPYAPAHPPSPQFNSTGGCSNYAIGSVNYRYLGTIALPAAVSVGVANPLPRNAYAQALRNDPEFLGSAAVRGAETSGRAYDFASFSVTAGYDNTDAATSPAAATQPAAGAAEVVEGMFVRHNKVGGVTYQ